MYPLDISNPKKTVVFGADRKTEGFDELDVTGTNYTPSYNPDGLKVTAKSMVGIANATADKFEGYTEPAFVRKDSKGIRGMMGGVKYCGRTRNATHSRRARQIDGKEYPYGCPPKNSAAGLSTPVAAPSKTSPGSSPTNGQTGILNTPASFRT